LKTIVKWIWVLAVTAFVSIYAHRKHETILCAASMLGWNKIIIALLLILCAKLGLVVNMKIASTRFGIPISLGDCFRIYNLTQLGKYIPGSIWQFVGRIVIMRERGVNGAVIRDALLAEHLWVILIASGLGSVLVSVNDCAYFSIWLKRLNNWWLGSFVFAGLLTAILGVVLAWIRRYRITVLFGWLASLFPPLGAFCALLVTWSFFGASLWITLSPYLSALPPLTYIIGAYCIAYVIGFVVPFAPAGLGIRDALLVLALAPLVGNEIAILLAGINRIIYFLAELLLAAISILMQTTLFGFSD
jgi:hypothetical protein